MLLRCRRLSPLFCAGALLVCAMSPRPACAEEATKALTEKEVLAFMKANVKASKQEARKQVPKAFDFGTFRKTVFGTDAKGISPKDAAEIDALLAPAVSACLYEDPDEDLGETVTVRRKAVVQKDGSAVYQIVFEDTEDDFRITTEVCRIRRVGGALKIVDVKPGRKRLSEVLKKGWALVRATKTPVEMIRNAERKRKHEARIQRSMDNLKSLAIFVYARAIESGRYGKFSGKNFVLQVIARGDLDRRSAESIEIFFAPGKEPAPVKAYAGVTTEALKTSRFPTLTSYAGRRNADPKYEITRERIKENKGPLPLFADLTFPDIVLVAFSDGSVKKLDRKALGLGPKDPIVVGDASKSPLLRQLSDK